MNFRIDYWKQTKINKNGKGLAEIEQQLISYRLQTHSSDIKQNEFTFNYYFTIMSLDAIHLGWRGASHSQTQCHQYGMVFGDKVSLPIRNFHFITMFINRWNGNEAHRFLAAIFIQRKKDSMYLHLVAAGTMTAKLWIVVQ